MKIKIEKTVAHFGKEPIPKNANLVHLNCPPIILTEFKKIMRNSLLLGSEFMNPYTHDKEFFPNSSDELTARHLQIIARNEASNVSGVMKFGLYEGSGLTEDQIARIRCLVKATTITGITNAMFMGGYGSARSLIKNQNLQKTIVIDQSGLQWQGDFRNTGGMFFYPEDLKDSRLPGEYSSWQKDMFQIMYGKERKEVCSSNNISVTWKSVKGRIDLEELSNAIETEFRQALDGAVNQGNAELGTNEKINFKYLMAGMGFFASGIFSAYHSTPEKTKLLEARLQGILNALNAIAQLSESEKKTILGKVGRIELPYSTVHTETAKNTISQIEQTVKKLGLKWGGTPNEDAYTPRAGYVNATTNCGDPHAGIGNESGFSSVDAALASNANLEFFNPAYNSQIQLRISPECYPGVFPNTLKPNVNLTKPVLSEPTVPAKSRISEEKPVNEQDRKKAFNNLTLIRVKLKDLSDKATDLKDRGYILPSTIAENLATELEKQVAQYEEKLTHARTANELAACKNDFNKDTTQLINEVIEQENKEPNLFDHRGFMKIIIYLFSACIPSDSSFFKTATQVKIENLKKSLEQNPDDEPQNKMAPGGN